MHFLDPATGVARTVEVRDPDCGSLEEMFHRCFATAGCVADRIVAGVAGRPEPSGDILMTNRKGWPLFRREAFERGFGVSLSVVNDMMASLAGVGCLGADELVTLAPDVPPASSPARVVASVGTGVGSSFMDATGGMHSSETGHVTWQPVEPDEWGYLRHLRKAYPGAAVSVEQAIGGLHGFDHMYDYASTACAAGEPLRAEVARARSEGRGVGQAVTAAAIDGDPCAQQIASLFGALLGQYLRNMALVHLAGGGTIYLTSGVLQAPGFAHYLVAGTPFREAFVGARAEHAGLMRTVPLHLVTDPEMAVKGAYALARSWDGTGPPTAS